MDTPKILLFPERGKTGAWKWEIWQEDKIVSNGMFSGSAEHAYTAAYEAMLRYEITRRSPWVQASTRFWLRRGTSALL
jgi:hypothetical protein